MSILPSQTGSPVWSAIVLDVVAVELRQKLVARQQLRERAIADAIELHVGAASY